MIGLEPRRLIADHRIGGCVGFVEPVVGEFLEQIENLGRLLGWHPVFRRAFFEFGAFGVHRLFDFFAHRAAQQVRTAQRIARHFLSDLHHLFLIDDDALRLGEDMVDQGVDGLDLFQPVFDFAIGRDILHRAGTVKRHQRNNVFDAGRLHAPQRIHHARAFHLEHRDRFRSRIEFVGPLVIQRDRVDLVFSALGGFIKPGPVGGDVDRATRSQNLVDGVLDHRQGFQPEKVKLYQPRLFDPFHVELGCGHVRARVLVKRHQRIQRPVADHNPRRVGRGIPQKPLNLLAIVEQTLHNFFVAGFFPQPRFFFQRLGDG